MATSGLPTTRNFNNQPFTFRSDGWLNMTKAAQAFGKRMDNFLANDETKEYMAALSQMPGIPVNCVEAKRSHHGGTFGHPKLAVFFARWLEDSSQSQASSHR